MKRVFVTTSWDDAHVLDERMAALLKKYDLKATFYIAPNNREIDMRKLLSSKQIAELSRDFEIGSHTISHPRLPLISSDEARREINQSKTLLESIVKKPVTTFCYPRGEFTSAHVEMVRSAGYCYARTVRRFAFSVSEPLTADTALHAYRHWSDAWDILKFASYNPIQFMRYYLDWETLARAMFDYILKNGGVFHLWGHSWEIDSRNEWERLERVFTYISDRSGVSYVSNGELV